MNKLSRLILNKRLSLKLLALGLFVATSLFTLRSQPTFAAPPNTLPENTNIFFTVSAGTTNETGTNTLHSPEMWLKIYAGTNDALSVRFINGKQCPNISGFDSGTRLTKFELHGVTSTENYFFYNGVTVKSSVNNVVSSNQNDCGDVVMNIPAGKLTESDVPGHTSPFGTKLFVGLIKVYLDPTTSTLNGPLNAFRVTAPGAYLGVWSKTITDATEATKPGGKNSTTMIGRPNLGSNTPTDDYLLRFRPPCTYFGGGINPQPKDVYLKWQDDDDGTSYQPAFGMQLYEYNDQTGAQTNVTTINTRSGGGEYASAKVTIRPFRKYLWKWDNITRRNGVQIFYPFDSADFDLPCPVFTSAGCDLVNDTDIPKQVKVNQVFNVTMWVGNSGSTAWGSNFKLGSGAENPSSSVDPKKHDNTFWQAKSNGNNVVNASGTRVTLLNYPVPGSSGSTAPVDVLPALREVKFSVTAPATEGDYPFWWQVVEEGVAWRGEPCKRTIEVVDLKNRPYISVAGGDILSGAGFGVAGTCPASGAAKQASIRTNGYHGTDKLNSLNGTSSAQYGVFASGDIGDINSGTNTFRGNYGYTRNGPDDPDDLRDGIFASIDIGSTDNYGHFYDDNLINPPLPCVDVSAEMASAAANPALDEAAAITFVASGSGYMKRTGKLDIPATLLTTGTRKTIVVDGNVTIKGNITYPATYTSASIPYLKIIANNIYIEANAKQIDANLVAYPNIATNGVLDTCSNMQWKDSSGNNIGATPGNWISANKVTTGSCIRNPNSFVVNGGVAARRIIWKRTNGTLASKDAAADSTCYYANYGDLTSLPIITDPTTAVQRAELCAAELIKFSPEAYLAGFSSGSQNLGTVPTSTQELPPIF